jgi:hypothetical protein
MLSARKAAGRATPAGTSIITRCGLQEYGTPEARNPKRETRNKSKIPRRNIETAFAPSAGMPISAFALFCFRVCFGFHASDFGFPPTAASGNAVERRHCPRPAPWAEDRAGR